MQDLLCKILASGKQPGPGGAIDLEVGDEARGKQGAPLDARRELRDVRDRGARIVVLEQRGCLQVEGEVQGMEVERPNPDGIPAQSAVESALHVLAERRVDQQGDSVKQNKTGEDKGQPSAH